MLFNVPLQSDAAPSIEAPSPTETFSSDSVLTTELPRPIAPRDAVRLSAYRAIRPAQPLDGPSPGDGTWPARKRSGPSKPSYIGTSRPPASLIVATSTPFPNDERRRR